MIKDLSWWIKAGGQSESDSTASQQERVWPHLPGVLPSGGSGSGQPTTMRCRENRILFFRNYQEHLKKSLEPKES